MEEATIVLSRDADAVVGVRHGLRRDQPSVFMGETVFPVRDEFCVALGDHEFYLNEGQLRVLRHRIDHALADQEAAIETREAWH
jgi:hypothetical protein